MTMGQKENSEQSAQYATATGSGSVEPDDSHATASIELANKMDPKPLITASLRCIDFRPEGNCKAHHD